MVRLCLSQSRSWQTVCEKQQLADWEGSSVSLQMLSQSRQQVFSKFLLKAWNPKHLKCGTCADSWPGALCRCLASGVACHSSLWRWPQVTSDRPWVILFPSPRTHYVIFNGLYSPICGLNSKILQTGTMWINARFVWQKRCVPFLLGSRLEGGWQWTPTPLIASAASPSFLRAGPVRGTIRVFLSKRRIFSVQFLPPTCLRRTSFVALNRFTWLLSTPSLPSWPSYSNITYPCLLAVLISEAFPETTCRSPSVKPNHLLQSNTKSCNPDFCSSVRRCLSCLGRHTPHKRIRALEQRDVACVHFSWYFKEDRPFSNASCTVKKKKKTS